MANFPIPQTWSVQPNFLDDGAIRRPRLPDRLDRRLDVQPQLPFTDVAFEGSSLLQQREHFESRGFGLLAD